MASDINRFTENVDYLMNGVTRPIGGKIYPQLEMMDSQTFNESFRFFQQELDELYAKTRLMQDVSAYAKSFIKKEIAESRDDLYEVLKLIEGSRDGLKDKGYMLKPVRFSDGWDEELKDRDGSVLDRCSVSKGTLGVSGQELENIPVSDITMKQELTAYSSNLEELKEGKEYRAFYILDGPAKNGVHEEFVIKFDKAYPINAINIEQVNSSVIKIALINENGIEEQVVGELGGGIALKKSTGIRFVIADKSHQQITYEIDSSRISSDFWKKVAERELAIASGRTHTFDMEKETGLKQYKESYAAHLSAMVAWSSAKAAVDSSNAARAAAYDFAYKDWASGAGSSAYE